MGQGTEVSVGGFHPELGGFRLEVLVLFSSSFEVKEHSFSGNGEWITNPAVVG